MSTKPVMVNEGETKITITFGPQLGGFQQILTIDLANMKSVVTGIADLLNLSQLHTSRQIEGLSKRLESLEKRLPPADEPSIKS
jgi:hypothetical protein